MSKFAQLLENAEKVSAKYNGPSRDAAGRHILTVDVEDSPQSTLDNGVAAGERVVMNTLALLELLDEAGARATFFVLGKVAERHRQLALEIARAGHEVATHGYSHESLASMSAKQFREELHRSVEILRDQTGEPVSGHRAADFSMSSKRLYYLEYLLREGLSYDSSIVPIRNPRYGIPGAYPYPHLIRSASRQRLIEFPPATMKLGGIRLTSAGGGYFRVLPYWLSKFTLSSFERSQHPATFYLDSYEMDAREIVPTVNAALAALHLRRFLQCASIRPKLRRLLTDFRFATMGEACKSLTEEELPVALDLAVLPIRYGNVAVIQGD